MTFMNEQQSGTPDSGVVTEAWIESVEAAHVAAQHAFAAFLRGCMDHPGDTKLHDDLCLAWDNSEGAFQAAVRAPRP